MSRSWNWLLKTNYYLTNPNKNREDNGSNKKGARAGGRHNNKWATQLTRNTFRGASDVTIGGTG